MAVENNEGLAKDPIRWYSSNSSFIFTQSYYVRLTGKRMNALFAARRFDKCACVGVYTGTQNWLSSGTRSLELDPHARARDVRQSHVRTTTLGRKGRRDE